MSLAKLVLVAAVAAVSLLPAAAMAQDDAGPVVITLSEYRFTPADITLTHGQHYVFRITDSGKRDHDLTAKEFFKTVTLDPDATGSVKEGVVDLTPGVTADIGFTPNQAGTFEMHCGHPFHAMLGMKGHIVVR